MAYEKQDYESVKKYDEILKENSHLKIHQEMLPYIGPNYDKHKILLISESHYVPKGLNILNDDEWYNPKDIKALTDSIEDNTHTRYIAEKIYVGKTHPLFTNINSALKKSNLKTEFNHVAWYNFYQKPAGTHNTINANEKDDLVAIDVFNKITNTITPSVIIFLSVKSFNLMYPKLTYSKESESYFLTEKPNIKVDYVAHPNSAWWNRQSKRYGNSINSTRTGHDKFIDLINKL
jgi:hypothetical protein